MSERRVPVGVCVAQELMLDRTLDENGLPDEAPGFEDTGLPPDYYVPVLHAYWNDDLTVA
jgi:hypothetical protein